jgi:hypothetical protein
MTLHSPRLRDFKELICRVVITQHKNCTFSHFGDPAASVDMNDAKLRKAVELVEL